MNQLVLLGVLIILSCTLIYLANSHEHFINSPLTPFIQQNQPYYNEAADLINPINPQLPLSTGTTKDFIKATISPDYISTVNPGTTKPLLIPSKQPDNVKVAQTICEKINTADCNAFDNKDFAANCGIALDIGTNSKGLPHTGGLYLSPSMRSTQKLNKLVINGQDYNTYRPTLGTSKVFTADKNSCLRQQMDLKCKQGHVIGSSNSSAVCSLCFTDGSYHATNKNMNPNPVTITLYTNADAAVQIMTGGRTYDLLAQGASSAVSASNNMTYNVYTSPPLTIREGDNIQILTQTSSRTNAQVAGFIKGPTSNGSNYSMDITGFISMDNNYPPVQDGTVQSYFIFIQQDGQTNVSLTGTVPFTFTMPPNYDATNCSNGPFITSAASMQALNADGDCYDPANGPGTYPVACLQKVFKGMGGTTKGTSYPTTQNPNTVQNLLYDPQGHARTLEQITEYLGDLAIQAATGLKSGVSLSIPEWNNVSMMMTGKAITNPCETTGNGPISSDCLNFLYTDPATYGNSVNRNESLDTNDFKKPLVCRPEGLLSPSNPSGLAKAKAAALSGGKQAVINLYKAAFMTANNTALSNKDRKQSLKDCYGVQVLPQKPEVYRAYTSTSNTYNDAMTTCSKLGAQLATISQLEESHKAGAQTCGCGYVADDQKPRFPMQEAVPGCWGDANNLSNCEMDKSSAAWCYGPKPDSGDLLPTGISIQPFVTTPSAHVPGRWSQYDKN